MSLRLLTGLYFIGPNFNFFLYQRAVSVNLEEGFMSLILIEQLIEMLYSLNRISAYR